MAETYSKSSSFHLICCSGNLSFQQQIKRHVPARYPGPDQLLGHINHMDGNTIYVSPLPLDDFPTPYVTMEESAAFTSRTDVGQFGRLLKSTTTPIKNPVDSPTSSTATAYLWQGGRGLPGGNRSRIQF